MRPTMSQYASRRDYDRAMAQRDLNPHAPAVAAMWLYADRRARLGLGSMGFWDSLTEHEQSLCRDMAYEIRRAPPEVPTKKETT